MEKNSWDRHQLHVLAQLEHLKGQAEKCESDNHQIRDSISELRADIASFKTHQKWELRILSAVWGLIMLTVNNFFSNE